MQVKITIMFFTIHNYYLRQQKRQNFKRLKKRIKITLLENFKLIIIKKTVEIEYL